CGGARRRKRLIVGFMEEMRAEGYGVEGMVRVVGEEEVGGVEEGGGWGGVVEGEDVVEGGEVGGEVGVGEERRLGGWRR
uniref:hypothetical protein n=1 Tax=Kocuria salsicia TaxID=664639 RepID=UPI001C92DBCE